MFGNLHHTGYHHMYKNWYTVWVTKRHENMKIKLEMESMDLKLSKSGLRMFLRPLVTILCWFLCFAKRPKKGVGGV